MHDHRSQSTVGEQVTSADIRSEASQAPATAPPVPAEPLEGARVRFFEADDEAEWDGLVARSTNGTFMHSRRFLSYHGDRFRDRSLVFTTMAGTLVGVFPAALDLRDPHMVVSHPGATYGGIVHDGSLQGRNMEIALERSVEAFRSCGATWLRYKAIPHIYHRSPAQDDVYWLHRLDARRLSCELSATIDTACRRPLSRMRRDRLRRAARGAIEVAESNDLAPFWSVLERTLTERHSVRPVHSLDEIRQLRARFPSEVRCVVAIENATVIAGSVLFLTDTVVHAQYYAASQRGRQVSALDMVIERSIELTYQLQRRYYDFGISTEQQGRILNEGLLGYKTSFGSGCCIYESYELPLH